MNKMRTDTMRAEEELGRKLGSEHTHGASQIESVLPVRNDSRAEADSNSRHMRL